MCRLLLRCRQESDIPQKDKLWPALRSTEPESEEEKRLLDTISLRGLPTEAKLRSLDSKGTANETPQFVYALLAFLSVTRKRFDFTLEAGSESSGVSLGTGETMKEMAGRHEVCLLEPNQWWDGPGLDKMHLEMLVIAGSKSRRQRHPHNTGSGSG